MDTKICVSCGGTGTQIRWLDDRNYDYKTCYGCGGLGYVPDFLNWDVEPMPTKRLTDEEVDALIAEKKKKQEEAIDRAFKAMIDSFSKTEGAIGDYIRAYREKMKKENQ